VLTGEKPQNAWQFQPAMLKWNWPAKTNVTVRAATNCDEVELFLNNHSLGRKTVSQNVYSTDYTVSFIPGELKAVGYSNGHQVAISKLITTGTATKVRVMRLSLPVAGDVDLFEVTLADKNDLNVIDATDAVTVHVEGAADLLALTTGDLVYDGLFKTGHPKSLSGRLLVTVQRNFTGRRGTSYGYSTRAFIRQYCVKIITGTVMHK